MECSGDRKHACGGVQSLSIYDSKLLLNLSKNVRGKISIYPYRSYIRNEYAQLRILQSTGILSTETEDSASTSYKNRNIKKEI